jgi:hypothetical protein
MHKIGGHEGTVNNVLVDETEQLSHLLHVRGAGGLRSAVLLLGDLGNVAGRRDVADLHLDVEPPLVPIFQRGVQRDVEVTGLHVIPQHEIRPAGDLRTAGTPFLLQAIKMPP